MSGLHFRGELVNLSEDSAQVRSASCVFVPIAVVRCQYFQLVEFRFAERGPASFDQERRCDKERHRRDLELEQGSTPHVVLLCEPSAFAVDNLRKRRWRIESEAILIHAAEQGRV
ncbi:hypothetical protein AB0B28_06620 [Glycomyces sp. NPDC046736]|uniref:hypothetical protein n=1 Tax=Glycomyces sp. NPDC046736 TaxID=3155615 RepID=UPI0033F17C68